MREDEARVRLQQAADWAAARGSLLFHLDLAAELGGTALTERGISGGLRAVTVDGDGYGVFALDEGPAPRGRAAVRFAADGRPVVSAWNDAPSAEIEALARARVTLDTARLADAARQTAIVLPPSSRAGRNDPLEGYAIALSDASGDVVMGVHWRAALSADGRRVLSQEPLSRSAMVLPGRDGAPPFGVQVTHFGAVPSEMHHHLSLKHGIDLFVAALDSGLVWHVEGERSRIEGPIEAS